VIVPFGRHRGQTLERVPTPYLMWLANRPDLRDPLASAVKAELEARPKSRPTHTVTESGNGRDLRNVARQLVDAGHRLLGLEDNRQLRIHARQAAEWLHGLVSSARRAPIAEAAEPDDQAEIEGRAEAAEALMARWRREDRAR
jgi:hypothetical protein